ncbi:MAG: ketohydroxyglutarate aldolase [Heteroscytonema crispum UTEX LB 1556]
MSDVKINISVTDECLDNILEVVADLQAAGMNVEKIMPILGAITGSIDSTKVDALSQIKGVAAVEISRNFRAI